MEALGLIGMMGLCSYDDVRDRNIRLMEVAVFGIIGVVLHIIYHSHSIESVLGGMAIGGAMYIVSILTKEKIGKGDAAVVGVIGIFLGFTDTLVLLWLSSVLAAIFGCVYIKVKKLSKDTELPFVPFMLTGYLAMLVFKLGAY